MVDNERANRFTWYSNDVDIISTGDDDNDTNEGTGTVLVILDAEPKPEYAR